MKKRIILLVTLCFTCIASACGANNGAQEKKHQLYEEAVAILEQTELKLDGSNEVSEELIIALENAEYTEPNNIIFMIGDGMGYNIIKAAQAVYAEELYQGTLAMNYMPLKSQQSTYSASSVITDSAAGGTALATGFKTKNDVVGMDREEKEIYRTTLELAAEKGKDTGIVATKAVTDATPASFTAHVTNRKLQSPIANMQLEKMLDGTLDLVLGGGRAFYGNKSNAKILQEAIEAGITYSENWEEILVSELPVVGLFAENEMRTVDESMPTIAEMTAYAIDVLSESEDGFFLMVEGSQIDSYAHDNNFEREVKELYDFDCAVAVAMRYVALHPDTVLIITADHETGGLTIPADVSVENVQQSYYTTIYHSEKAVPVFAAGYGTEALLSVNENTDIAAFVASLLGEESFGEKSIVYSFIDTAKKADIKLLQEANPSKKEHKFAAKGKHTVVVSFDEEYSEFVMPLEARPELWDSIRNVRAFHVTVKNPTDTTQVLPEMKMILSGKEYVVKPQVDYIASGETFILSYTMPQKCWEDNMLNEISEIILCVKDSSSTLEFSDMRLTERILEK